MTTMNEMVTRIARKIGIVGAGEVPVGSDAEDILVYLQSVIDLLPLLRDGEWVDVILTDSSAYTASDGERIAPQGFDPVITLPTTYLDDCNVEKIQRDLSRVHVIGDGLYIWSSSKGGWGKTDGLELDDDLPFGPEDEAGLVALGVLAASDEYGAQPSPLTLSIGQGAIRSFEARFYREVSVGVDPAFLRMSDMGHRGFCH